jgi:uncharacterized protein (UPF0332 family)
MSRPDGHLKLARRLLTLHPKQDNQVELGRAVVTAYYALFHLLTEDVARLFVTDNEELIARLIRTVDHKPLKDVSGQMIGGNWPNVLKPTPSGFVIPTDLTQVAKAVVRLQGERHRADYDRTYSLTRIEASELVDVAEGAFAAWRRVRLTDAARLYLACVLLWKTWNDKEPR